MHEGQEKTRSLGIQLTPREITEYDRVFQSVNELESIPRETQGEDSKHKNENNKDTGGRQCTTNLRTSYIQQSLF